jgi:hypothetical protein|tara:strand:+ start:9839 stop:10027 length:189 start_codon:yes stop_codon:yes gene_type:complete
MTTQENYEKARLSHQNKFGKSDSVAQPAREAAYRESANQLRDTYALYAAEMKEKGDPIPCWI